jgi:hypothetical protein
MIITERKFGVTKIGNIFFSEEPVTVNIPDFDVLTYYTYKNWDEIKGFEKIQRLATTIDLTQDIDDIWKKIKRQHKRHIHRSEKSGIEVKVSTKFEEFHRFYQRYLKQKNYAGPFGLNIISLKFMQDYGTLFIAEYEGEIVGGNVFLHDEENVLSVSIAYQFFEDSPDKNKMVYDANCSIHWEAMQYFKNLDINNYDFGGMTYFTRSFGGDVLPQYYYRQFNSQFKKLLFHSWNYFTNL